MVQPESFRLTEVPTRPHCRRAGTAELRTTPRTNPGAVHNRPHTLRRQARTDDAFLLAVRGANAMAGARLHRAEPGARCARPTKGGAVRIRIALGTAVAVIAIPAIFFAFFSSTSAASARVTRHEASSQHRTGEDRRHTDVVRPSPRTLAKMVNYANAVDARPGGDLPHRGRLSEGARCRATAARRRRKQQARSSRSGSCAARSTRPAPSPRRRRRRRRPRRSGGGSDATSTNTADWACIRQHESGGNYSVGNGGAYQFELGTWTR